jgi:putative acetyltransferase
MQIRVDDLRGTEIAALLRTHLDEAAQHSPAESMHALDLDGLRAPGITFWSMWEGDALLGCGALKELDPTHGEIKSMHTAHAHRGRGVAAAILRHIIEEARRRAYRRLSLETGSMESFAPARILYARHGFVECEPFADYVPDPYSTFMTLDLAAPSTDDPVTSRSAG